MVKSSLRIIKFVSFFVLFSLLFFEAHSVFASTVTAIEFQGNGRTDRATLLKVMRSSVGAPYSREAAHQDIKNIYSLGLFSNVEIDKQESGSTVKLTVKLKEKPLISKILVQGAKAVSEEKVKSAVIQKELQVLDEGKVAQSKEKIKELYTKEGLGLVVIQTAVEPAGSNSNESNLVFKISENKGLKVSKISFEGNKAFSSSKLKRLMKTKEKSIISFLTGSGKYREEAIERDVAFLTYQYLNQGYLKIQVDKPEMIPLPDGKGMELKFRISEGNRYKVRDIQFSGDILTTEPEIRAKLNTLKGNYYSQKIMEEDLERLSELYGNLGYAFANIRPEPNPDDSAQEVDIKFNFEKGDKVKIEQINITGNTVTRDKVIRRELKLTENSLYNEKLLKESKRRLEALGYFESVEFSTPKGSSDDKLVLNINVKEKPTGSFSVGGGYSSVESFIFTASISKQNFLGYGISGSVLAEISKKRQEFSLQLYDPYFLDTRWIFNSSVSKLLTRYDDFDRDSLGGELNIGHHLFDHSSFTVGYHIEDVKVKNFSAVVPEFFKKDASGLTSSIVASIERDTRNNRITATKGSYNQAGIEYAGLGGDNKFLRFNANSRWFLPIKFPKNSVLKANGRIGYIKSLDDKPVPLFERYFTGGVNSVRGFRPRSLGPSLQIPSTPTGGDQNFVYGGNKLMVFNLEYEFPIYDPAGIRAVLFADAGNAFAENEQLNPLKLRTNWGFGLRWLSPFGPLRFEWGLPFKKKPGEDRIVFQFTVGSFF